MADAERLLQRWRQTPRDSVKCKKAFDGIRSLGRTMKTIPTKAADAAEHNRRMVAAYPMQVSALPEEEGGGFQALFPPLARSVVGYGATPQEAIADLQAVAPTFLALMGETGQTLPEVAVEKQWEEFSGKFNVRVAKALHAQLVELAEEQGVSLNSLVQTALTSAATALAAGKMFGAVEDAGQKPVKPHPWGKTAPTGALHDAAAC